MEDLFLQELDIFRPQFDSKKIRIETPFGKGVDRPLADPDKISQVVTNLLRNACQYTPTGGFVRIYTQQASGGYEGYLRQYRRRTFSKRSSFHLWTILPGWEIAIPWAWWCWHRSGLRERVNRGSWWACWSRDLWRRNPGLVSSSCMTFQLREVFTCSLLKSWYSWLSLDWRPW